MRGISSLKSSNGLTITAKYVNPFLFMIKCNINTFLIEQMHDEGYLREVAVWMRLKNLYISGSIHNYSYRTLSVKSGISINVLKECLPFFKLKGWVREEYGHLIFNPMYSLDGFRKKALLIIKIKVHESYKDILKKLKLLLLKIVHNRFEHIKKVIHDCKNSRSLKVLKAAKKAAYRIGITRPIGAEVKFSISNRKFGSILKRSKSTSSRLIGWGHKNGVLKKEQRIIQVDPDKACFFIKGIPLRYLSNLISF